MKLLKPFALILIFYSCKNVDQKSHTSGKKVAQESVEQHDVVNSTNDIAKGKRIGDFMSDTTDFIWSAKQSDTASYWIRVTFQKEFALYQFHGQCLYWFFTDHYYTGTNKIELLWSYKTDCVLDMDFLRKSNGIKKYPKLGDAFSEYQLVNNSVIEVKYNFPEWTNEINKMERDSIFPRYLHLEKKGGI